MEYEGQLSFVRSGSAVEHSYRVVAGGTMKKRKTTNIN